MTNLDQISLAIGQLQAKTDAIHASVLDGFKEIKGVTDDHEERIKKNEHGLIRISVIGASLGALGTFIVSNIFNVFNLFNQSK